MKDIKCCGNCKECEFYDWGDYWTSPDCKISEAMIEAEYEEAKQFIGE